MEMEDGRMGGWEDGRMRGWEDERMGGWEDGRMGECGNGRAGWWEVWKHGMVDGKLDHIRE